jgi:hypothetical protein
VGGWPKLLTTWSAGYPKPGWAKLSAKAMPDGWVLAELLLLLRDCLVFEGGERLVLLGGVDPGWLAKEMSLNGMPIPFGPLTPRYRPDGPEARLTLEGADPPGGYILRLSSERDAAVRAGDRAVSAAARGDFPLPAGTREATIRFWDR